MRAFHVAGGGSADEGTDGGGAASGRGRDAVERLHHAVGRLHRAGLRSPRFLVRRSDGGWCQEHGLGPDDVAYLIDKAEPAGLGDYVRDASGVHSTRCSQH